MYSVIIFKMSSIQSKLTQYMKKQENLNLHGKRKQTDVTTKVTHMLKLSDKDFKAATIKNVPTSNCKHS